MSTTAKGGKGKFGRGKQQTTAKSTKSSGRISRFMRCGKYADRIGAGAPAYMAAISENLATQILELAGNAAKDNKKIRLQKQQKLNKLMLNSTISSGGVIMLKYPSLQQKKEENKS